MRQRTPRFDLLFASLLLAAAGLMASPARAADAVLTWTAPTQNEDGTPLTDLSGYKVYYGTVSATLTQTASAGAAALGYTVTGLAPGTWYFAVTALSTAGGESARTGQVSKVIVAPKPKPPTGLTVASPIAYTVIKRVDRFVMLPVGTVPADTVCDTTQGVNGYYVVPRSAVTWSGSVRPDVVVAQCG